LRHDVVAVSGHEVHRLSLKRVDAAQIVIELRRIGSKTIADRKPVRSRSLSPVGLLQ
jgi:hypothetical protein